MISRATSVYIIMLVVFGAGLWGILSFGAILLRAPTDLAGKWDLIDVSSADPQNATRKSMSIEQSGRYFRINFGSTLLSLKMSDEKLTNSSVGLDTVWLALDGNGSRIEWSGVADGEEYDVTLTGSNLPAGKWRAIRTNRTYAQRQHDKSSTKPSASVAPHS